MHHSDAHELKKKNSKFSFVLTIHGDDRRADHTMYLSTCCIIAARRRFPQNTRLRSDVTERILSARAPVRILGI